MKNSEFKIESTNKLYNPSNTEAIQISQYSLVSRRQTNHTPILKNISTTTRKLIYKAIIRNSISENDYYDKTSMPSKTLVTQQICSNNIMGNKSKNISTLDQVCTKARNKD